MKINYEKCNMIDMKHVHHTKLNNKYVFFNTFLILQSYNNFNTEYDNNKKTQHYSVLWYKNNIYR